MKAQKRAIDTGTEDGEEVVAHGTLTVFSNGIGLLMDMVMDGLIIEAIIFGKFN